MSSRPWPSYNDHRTTRAEPAMDRDSIALFRELADRSPSERDDYYARHQVPAALRAEVESLLRFDDESTDPLHGYVASAAERVVLLHDIDVAGSRARPPIDAGGRRCGPYRLLDRRYGSCVPG
jgi:hypothetical protein